jgi:PKD repeat protein
MKKSFLFFLVFTLFILKSADSQTTIVLQPGPEGKDAGLWSIMPDNNYGFTPKFVSSGWTHSGVPGINRTMIDFDLSLIPEGAQILEARLDLSFVCLEPTFFGHTGDNEANLQLITDPWEEDSVTWNTQPATTEDFQVYLPASTDPYQDYTDIDVTILIQKLRTEPENYHGIMMRLINENPYRALLFASGDYADTVEFRPRLEITYLESPTVTIEIQPGEEGKDAQLWSITPDLNIGNSPKFVCSGWTHGGEPGINRAIVDFDLSSIPAEAQIVDAKLNFYFVCLEPTFFGHTGENDAYLQLITDPWEEDSVTWNNQPAITEDFQLYLPPSVDPYQDYTDLDVTALVQKLHQEPESYHGIMLRLLNENPYRCLLFVSSDYTDTIEFRPKLVVTYTTAPDYTIVLQPGPEEGKDAQLWTILPDTNYGDIPKFDCSGWTHYGVPGVNRAVIDFDLSAIPAEAEVTDARLNLYFVCLEPSFFGHTGYNDAYLQLITEPWEEDVVTWNNQPASTEDFQVYLPPSTDPYQDYTDIDITEFVQKLKAQPETYHGIMLRLLDESPYRCLLFASSDYSDTVEMRPKLEITYQSFTMPPVASFSYESEALTVSFQNSTLAGESYIWDFGDGNYSDQTNPVHIYNTAGSYPVCLYASNRNGSDTTCTELTLQITNSPVIEEITFSVYPNPAKSSIRLRSNLQGATTMTIADFNGRALINKEVNFSNGTGELINIEKLTPGMYFIRLSTGSNTGTAKFVVVR